MSIKSTANLRNALRLFLALIIFLLAYPHESRSQNSTTLGVYARVLRIMTVDAVGANHLDFGTINVSASSQNFSISNQNGQKFLATGSPNYIIYADWPQTVTLDNNAWVLSHGGTPGTLTFEPNDIIQQTGDNENWSGPYSIQRNTYYWSSLYLRDSDNDGVGKTYFWLGGDLTIPGNQPNGDYIGTLVFTVSY